MKGFEISKDEGTQDIGDEILWALKCMGRPWVEVQDIGQRDSGGFDILGFPSGDSLC